MRRMPQACLPLLLLVAAGCNSGDPVVAAPTCQQPSAALVNRITELAPEGSRFTVLKTAGQKATTKASTWWVAVRFTAGASSAAQKGIWAIGGGLDGHGTLLAVDPVAQQWSEATDADTSASKIPDTEGTEVLACL